MNLLRILVPFLLHWLCATGVALGALNPDVEPTECESEQEEMGTDPVFQFLKEKGDKR